MQLTGFTDEASRDLSTQLRATKELGWGFLSARGVDGVNIHELSEAEFSRAAGELDEAGIRVAEFGSLIGNWGKSIESDFSVTTGEIDRAIPRMQRLGVGMVRVMSYAQEPWGSDQHEQERFTRLREIVRRFSDAGIVAAHENCMNYGGFSSQHSLELVNEVPGMKLIFDTGNPVFQRDRSKPDPQPWQDAWGFYEAVREHVVHVHIKDCLNPVADGVEPGYVFPGEGQAEVSRILADLKARNYEGFIAIEPHVATVFHVQDGAEPDWQQCYDSYVAYGRALERLIGEA